MDNKTLMPFIAVLAIVLVNGLLAYLVGGYSVTLLGYSAFTVCIALAFVIQWIAFVPAYLSGSERYFDLMGSITYVSVSVVALFSRDMLDLRSLLIAIFVSVWAVRLGSFLARRIHAEGKDGRFDKIKGDFGTFLMTWTLQGMWVSFCYSAGLAAITSVSTVPFDAFLVIGGLVWVIGFTIEVVADNQKTAFRADPSNRGNFIQAGLWSRSRHPNYFGEILIWTGITLIALPVLQGWQYLSLISPVFTWLLLTRISGVRMLEARGKKRWGEDPEYQAYLASTPQLVPRLR